MVGWVAPLFVLAAQPNIVLVTLDTLRADRLGCYGHEPSPSPRIDALAAESVRFTDAITPVPLTVPAHATLFSGLNARDHGVFSNAAGIGADVPMFVDQLESAGYHSAAFVSGAPVSTGSGLEHRFEWFDDARPDALGAPRFPPERRGAATAGAAAAWIATAEEPFVLWVHLFDAHAPYTPVDGWVGDPYDGEVAAVDAAVGRVLDALTARDIDARTAVVVTADHGEALGAHDELTHGVLLYQATLHVPLIVRTPGARPARVTHPVGLIDIAPTVLAIAGEPAGDLPGLDLRRAGDLPAERALLAVTHHGAQRYGWAVLEAVRQGAWKLIEAPRPELYHLQDDPSEAVNRIGDRPDVAAALKRAGAPDDAPDPTLMAQLQALGYVTDPTTTTAPDPKDRVHLLAPMEEATRALYAEDFAEARRLLAPVVREDPDNPVAWNDLGMAWLGLDKPARGAEAFRRAVAVAPRDAAVWNNLGLAEARAGRPDSARVAYAQAARILPEFAAPCVNMAVLYYRTGDMEAARRWAAEALNRAPGMPEAIEVLDRAN